MAIDIRSYVTARRGVARASGLRMPMALAFIFLLLLATAASASAQPAWQIEALANSTASPGGDLTYVVEVRNVGDVELNGAAEPISFSGQLPAGLTIASVTPAGELDCSELVAGQQSFTCHSSKEFTTEAINHNAYTQAFLVHATVGAGASGLLTSRFEVSGGEPSDGDPSTPSASTVAPATITSAPAAFGVAAFDAQVTGDAGGTPFTQAGGHPFAASTSIDFNTRKSADPLKGDLTPVEASKDVEVDLPPGFFGDPSGVAQCTLSQLSNSKVLGVGEPLCPTTSQVGTTSLRLNGKPSRLTFGPIPVFNIVPPPNVPARLGFNALGSVVVLDVSVRSAGDYGLTAHVRNIPEGLAVAGSTVTLWGVPSDPAHDPERGCPGDAPRFQGGGSCPSGAPRTAFLRNPTSCTAPGVGLATTVRADSWVHPGVFSEELTVFSHLPSGYPFAQDEWGPQIGTTGCQKVPFDPSVSAAPDSTAAAQPSGFSFDLSLPQTTDPSVIAQSDLKKAVVTLPQGMRVSPSSAAGLQACSPTQIALHTTTAPSCPDASKLGNVSVKTPALPDPLQGAVYLATPHNNPFNTLLALYIVAEGSGVLVKLAGRVDADPATGQLTATFDDNPQLPFSKLHVDFRGGPRAALVTPPTCGTYTTHAQLSGWSGADVPADSSFSLTQGPGGAPCAPPGFSPSFAAGTTNAQAGAFTAFSVTIARSDSDQELHSVQVQSPPGLLGALSSVALCGEPQAAQGSCSPASQIGHTTVAAGAGQSPLYLPVPGQGENPVYLTGPYRGAPFGLSVVVPAIAGPFDLGTVVERAAINVDPHSSQITISSDPLPQILQGVPLQVRSINVSADRAGFIFNPTNCSPLSVNATLTSTQAQSVGRTNHFEAANCANLAFKPSFTVSTAGATSKANGASLRVHLATHEGPGQSPGESDVAKVDVQLPGVLPSRLTTLQKACTAAQFDANPAGCPEGSFVGTAIAHTPILQNPLTGPAILVSHGGQAFPDLVLVLQGEGVRIDLTGNTQIKKGITYSHFDTVPDAPVSSFDLNLPQGPHSVLAANANLCANTRTVTSTRRVTRRVKGHNRKVTVKAKKTIASPLSMPTTITAQNGAVINQSTKIAVTGCRAKAARHARKATARRRGR